MKYKVGDIVRQFTDDRRVSWRGVVAYVGPITEITRVKSANGKWVPLLDDKSYWIEWDNGSSNRVDEDRIEFDKQQLRTNQLNKLGI